MFNYIIYETNTGKINSYLTVAYETDIQLQDLVGKSFIEIDLIDTDSLQTSYIKDGKVIPRPKQNTLLDKTNLNADGIDEIFISSAPENAILIVTNDDNNLSLTESINGSDTFSTNISGKTKLEIIKFPYLDFSVVIYAN